MNVFLKPNKLIGSPVKYLPCVDDARNDLVLLLEHTQNQFKRLGVASGNDYVGSVGHRLKSLCSRKRFQSGACPAGAKCFRIETRGTGGGCDAFTGFT